MSIELRHIMRVLKKNKIMFVTVTSMVLMIVGCFHYMSIVYTNVISPPNFMSWQTLKYNFSQIKIPELSSNFYYKDFRNLLQNVTDISVYHSFDENQNGSAVFFDDFNKMNVKLLKGRVFTQEDIKHNLNVVLLSEEMLEQCKIINGKLNFYFDGNYYEVIGVYQKQEHLPKYFVNLFSDHLSNNILNGIVYLDGEREMVRQLVGEIEDDPINFDGGMSLSLEVDYGQRGFAYFISYLGKSWLFTLLVMTPAFLLILNANIIISYIVALRYDEFYSRFITGCSFNGIRKQVGLEIFYIFVLNYGLVLVVECLCNLRRSAVADAFSSGRPAVVNGC